MENADPMGPEVPCRLYLLEAQAAGWLRLLAEEHPQHWHQLLEDTRRAMACLQGLCFLEGWPCPKAVAAASAAGAALARRCYVNLLSLIRAYTKYAQDLQYGPAFAELAQSARRRSALLLQALGK